MLPTSVAAAQSADPEDAALAFDGAAYTTITVTVDGQPTPVRRYNELCYVANPVAAAAQQPGLVAGARRSRTRAAATRA